MRSREGRLGSGKNTRRFKKINGLLDFSANLSNADLYIRFPSGDVISHNESELDSALSTQLGETVNLVEEDGASHMDADPIHLLTSGSLTWLSHALPNTRIDERRFRPNILIEIAGDQPIEQNWVGATVRIGSQVKLQISTPTERCGMVAFAQDDLELAPEVLRYITKESNLRLGVYAKVVTPGWIRFADVVSLC